MWESIVINVNADEHKKILCQVVGEFFWLLMFDHKRVTLQVVFHYLCLTPKIGFLKV